MASKKNPPNLARRGTAITLEQACVGRENKWVTYFVKDHQKNKRGFAFYIALEDDLNKRKAKLVTLFHRFWYIITYKLKEDHFYIVEPWLELYQHNIYNSLLNGPKKEQRLLDEGLSKSQNQEGMPKELSNPP